MLESLVARDLLAPVLTTLQFEDPLHLLSVELGLGFQQVDGNRANCSSCNYGVAALQLVDLLPHTVGVTLEHPLQVIQCGFAHSSADPRRNGE